MSKKNADQTAAELDNKAEPADSSPVAVDSSEQVVSQEATAETTEKDVSAAKQETSTADNSAPIAVESFITQTANSKVSSSESTNKGVESLWWGIKFVLLVLACATTLSFGLVFGVTIYRSYFAIPDEIEVPAINGKDIQEVNQMLTRLGLRLRIEEGRHNDKFPSRIVISQDPEPGKTVRKDREVLAVVSLGPERLAVPDLRGKSLREAKMLLANSRLELGKVSYTKADSGRPDEVIRQKPTAGALVKRSDSINVEMNRGFGMATVAVPDWKGKSISNAQVLLDKVGLRMGRIIWRRSDSVAKGRIIKQTPPSGSEVTSDTEVAFEVSAGADGDTVFVQRKLEIFLPAGSDSHSLKIMLLSGSGEEEVYRAEHVVGDNVVEWVSGPAGSEIEVYVNDKLFLRDRL